MNRHTVAMLAAIVSLAFMACGGASTAAKTNPASVEGGSTGSVVQDSSSAATTPLLTSAPVTTIIRQNISIMTKGFTQLSAADSIGGLHVSYGVTIKNPNVDWNARGISVNITLTDAAGTVVRSISTSVGLVLPGQTAAVGDSSFGTGATKMDVQAVVATWERASAPSGTIRAEGVATTADTSGGRTTTASLTSTFANTIKSPKGVAIYLDTAGNIVGGAWRYIDFVPASGKVGFELRDDQTVPHVSQAQVYVALPAD